MVTCTTPPFRVAVRLNSGVRAHMKILAIGIVFLSCLLSACTNSVHQPIASPITSKLVELSGPSANDCGIIHLNASLESGWNCAVENDADARPFWLAVRTRGIDSDSWRAIGRARNGDRFVLSYDSNPSGGPGLNPRIIVDACAGNFEWAHQEAYVLGCSGSAP